VFHSASKENNQRRKAGRTVEGVRLPRNPPRGPDRRLRRRADAHGSVITGRRL